MSGAAAVTVGLIVVIGGAAGLLLLGVLVVGYSISHVSYPIDRSADIEGREGGMTE